ncbi:Uu.00g035200.m01.CDS01 [Anthostomella pinea]|uniref:Uu.00g035200.m01.CDS01 n=1 Tax=Anthostomella pinea TaxID=933095 RepID=A0AAI8V9U1_9PEZI|nr:Uu.00g035200.m01.CDS01 [Anthostomella pinea]
MYSSNTVIVLSLLSAVSGAAPTASEDTAGRYPSSSVEARDALPGISWLYASAECQPWQYDNLVRAFTDVSQLSIADNAIPEGNNPEFEDFFGQGYTGNQGALFWEIFDNLNRAAMFPSTGEGGVTPATKIYPRCNDVANHCSSQAKVSAYTGDASLYSGPPGAFIVLCPFFWTRDFPHLLDRVAGTPTNSLNSLMTQEHIVLHELMHANAISYGPDGGAYDILDLKSPLPGESDNPNIPGSISSVAVYGVQRCKKFAAKGSPNIRTRKNADNYAWFASGYYFSKAWGVAVDGGENILPPAEDPTGFLEVNDGTVYGDDLVEDEDV